MPILIEICYALLDKRDGDKGNIIPLKGIKLLPKKSSFPEPAEGENLEVEVSHIEEVDRVWVNARAGWQFCVDTIRICIQSNIVKNNL